MASESLYFIWLSCALGYASAAVKPLFDRFGDALSIGVSFFLERRSKKAPDQRHTYGYGRYRVIGGLITLSGLFLLYHQLGTLQFSQLGQAAAEADDRALLWTGGLLTLVGFGAKAGAFPLHIWLPTAHPAAPAPASAVLSGMAA